MPSDLDIEILTIDDSAPAVKTVLNKTKNPLKKKWRTVRKSTGVGGKAPHSAIPFKPLRKSLPVKPISPRKTRNANPEYFDVEDDDSDDEIQVIEYDPLDGVEVLGEGPSEGFCDMCGLYLENSKDMENHHETRHKLVTCKWCQNRLATTEIKNHIGAKLCSKFTKLLGSHCSIHNEIETDDQLEMEGFKKCRPLACDACAQRYDVKSLRDFDEKSKSYICPGCLHGRIDASEDMSAASAAVLNTTVTESSNEENDYQNSKSNEKISRPIPQFLSTPNPIPLPEILLLDDAEEEPKSIVEEESTQNVGASIIEKVSKENTEAEVAVITETSTSINSPSKKRSNNDLTSKLVEMINSELQDKVDLNDIKVRSCEKVAVALPTIELPKDDAEKGVDDVADVEIVTPEIPKDIIEKEVDDKSPEIVDIEIVATEPIKDAVIKEVHDKTPEILDVEESLDEIEVLDITENDTVAKLPKTSSVEDVEPTLTSLDVVPQVEDVKCTTPTDVVPQVEDVECSNTTDVVPQVEDVECTNTSDILLNTTDVLQEDVQSTNTNLDVVKIDSLNSDSLKESSTNTQSSSELPTKEDSRVASPPSSPGNTSLQAPTPVRRVARKSTKPPQNPQRLPECPVELLLFDTPSPKRKLQSPTTSVRKVARKSTKPPANPQRTLFSEETIIACHINEMDTSILFKTPEKDKNEMEELEVLDEICGGA